MNDRKHHFLLVTGIGVSNLGSWIYLVAINLLVVKMTGSAAAVAGLFIIRPIAMLFTNSWSGGIIDRADKRKLMIIMDCIRGVLVAVIPFLTSVWAVYAVLFAINLGTAFFGPASAAYITKLVPAEKRQKFNSLFSFANSGAILIGPGLSGILILSTSIDMAIYLNALSFFLCALAIYFLPGLDSAQSQKQKMNFSLLAGDWVEISRFAKGAGYFMLIYILFQAAVLFGFALDSQEVTFIKKVINLSDRSYGILCSMAGVGYLAGSVACTALASRLSLKSYIGIGLFFNMIGYLLFYSSSHFVFAGAAFIILGFFASFANAGIATFLQNQVPGSLMGRFMSVTNLLQGIIQIIFTLILGFLADIFTLQPVSIIFSLIAVILSVTLSICMNLPNKKKHFSISSTDVTG